MEVLLMSCELQSEWLNKLIKSSATPMEILLLQWCNDQLSIALLAAVHCTVSSFTQELRSLRCNLLLEEL